MRKILLLNFLLMAALCWQCNFNESPSTTQQERIFTMGPSSKKYKVVAYVAGYRDFDFSSIQAQKLTHINYAFANIIDGKVCFGGDTQIDETDLNEDDIRALQGLKMHNPALKILVSVGGWTWSTHFSEVALTEASRERFAISAVDFLKKYNLDGIDLDWEYPNQIGAGNPYRPEDVENFTLLLKAVRLKLDAQSRQDGLPEEAGYLLSIATGGDEAYVRNTRLRDAIQYLDFINIMTYDAYNGLHRTTGHHANLFPADGDPAVTAKGEEVKSAFTSVLSHLKAGVPARKINLGLAFYGRVWNGVNKENNGLFQEAQTVGMIKSYHEIVQHCTEENGYQQFWDASAAAAYLWQADSGIFISYEIPKSIRLKLEYLKKEGLGGVMFWEYTDDYHSELLDVINQNL